MAHDIYCPDCGNRYTLLGEKEGETAVCSFCNRQFVIGSSQASPAEASEQQEPAVAATADSMSNEASGLSTAYLVNSSVSSEPEPDNASTDEPIWEMPAESMSASYASDEPSARTEGQSATNSEAMPSESMPTGLSTASLWSAVEASEPSTDAPPSSGQGDTSAMSAFDMPTSAGGATSDSDALWEQHRQKIEDRQAASTPSGHPIENHRTYIGVGLMIVGALNLITGGLFLLGGFSASLQAGQVDASMVLPMQIFYSMWGGSIVALAIFQGWAGLGLYNRSPDCRQWGMYASIASLVGVISVCSAPMNLGIGIYGLIMLAGADAKRYLP